MFIKQESRDAYAVIRGFVYQVERTILAWLDLDEETVLYCECGEDIDYVRQFADTTSKKPIEERLLEQVKYRQQAALSLRSKEILETIANFIIHKQNNPQHQLKLRFFTNALPAKEKGISFPRGLSGLEAWEEVRTNSYNRADTQTSYAYIRRILKESGSNLSPDRAEPLLDFLSSADEQALINELIRPIEWAMGNEDTQQMRPLIESKIAELGYAKELSEVEEIYNRLITYIFQILSLPGDKRLDRKTLFEIVKKDTLTAANRELLKEVWDLLKKNEGKIEAVKSEVTALRAGQLALAQEMKEGFQHLIESVNTFGASDLPVVTALKRPTLDDPVPLPESLAPREELINSILIMLKKFSWVALTASTGMGKTLIGRILFDYWPNQNKFWISLKNISGRFDSHINEQLFCIHYTIVGDWRLQDAYYEGNISLQEIDYNVANSIGSNSLLIIDDLPDLLQVSSLTQRLTSLGTECRKGGVKVITTSQHKLAQEIINMLDPNISLLDIPSMNKEDIKALFTSAGAPTYLQRDSVYGFILGVTKGHPVLVTATVRWLSINGWKIDIFNALLSGEPMQEVKQETSKLTRQLISDISTRDMLDRLSIIGTSFNADMASVVGKTKPAVERPKEHFYELVGPWIQPLTKSKFEVSPLLQDLWRLYLEPDLQKRLHYDIAHDYLKKKTIVANDALQVCIHLHTAEDWDNLVPFLIQFTLQIKTSEHAKYFDWVQWFFSPGRDWPDSIPLSMRIFIRALQTRILIMSGQEYERYDTDLESLISVAGDEDMMAVAAARFHTGATLDQASPGLTAKRAIEAARAWHSIEHKIPRETIPVAPELLFWGAITKLTERNQIKPVIEVIKSMSEEERNIVFSSDIGPEMSVLFADSCYAVESAKDKENQNWEEIIAILEELQEIGQLPGAEPLYTAAIRARAIVLTDFQNDTDGAIRLLSESLPGLNNDSVFILLSTKSIIMQNQRRSEEAFNYFLEALSIEEGRKYRLLYSDTLKFGMLAANQTKHFEHAKAWCKRALNIVKERKTGQMAIGIEYPYYYLELLGELSWILWNSGSPIKSCAAMYAVVQQLVENNDIDNPHYKETFLKTGHVLGWLASVAYKGEPPSITVGGEEYVTPYPGIFCYRAPRMAELPYIAGKNSFLLSQIAMMASGVGALGLAKKAYLSASDIAKKEGLLAYATIMEQELASLNSFTGDYEAAFKSFLAGIIGIPLIKRGMLDTKDNPVEVWKALSAEEKRDIEDFHIYHLIMLPALAGLLKYNNNELCLKLIDKMQEVLELVQESLLTYDRSVNFIKYIRLVFDTAEQRQNILDSLRTLKPDDHYERLILYIALASQSSAKPGEIANTQAIILPYINEIGVYGNFTIKSISEWTVKSWYEELENRSFRLNSPHTFRKTLEGIPRTSNLVSDAARVLLDVEYASGSNYDNQVREQLKEIANPK